MVVTVMAVGILLGGMVGVVFAATSGVVYKFTQTGESYGTTMICNEAQINISGGTATNVGIVRARTTTGCANAKSLRAGYLGVSIYGFRNGSVCGGIGPRYTSSATSAMTVAGSICSNPSGSQYFRTQMLGFLYRPSTGQYRSAEQYSPNQSG
jgi:hypothetical protein